MPSVTLTRFWHEVDGALVRTAARQAAKIRAGLKASVDVNKMVESFLNDHTEATVMSPAQARTWTRLNVIPDNRKLSAALTELYAVGYVLGQDAGLAAIARTRTNKAMPTNEDLNNALAIDWSVWKAGNRAAAALANPKNGLQRLLSKRVSTLRGLSDTTLDRIGTGLAKGLEQGLAAEALKSYITAYSDDVLMSSSRALTIANTEMNSAMSLASMDTYAETGIEMVEWIGLEACDICDENIDASPIPIGQEFPSGDTEPAAHGNCRCSIAPVVDWGEEGRPNFDYSDSQQGYYDEIMAAQLELSLKPTVSIEPVSGVPGPAEIERAISRLTILPNPNDPTLDQDDLEKLVESPWETVEVPTIDPNVWDKAVKTLVNLDDLYGTDPYLSRKKVRKHIEALGQALTEFRSYPLVVVVEGRMIIIDGHHRLMSIWLLGQTDALVWKVELNG